MTTGKPDGGAQMVMWLGIGSGGVSAAAALCMLLAIICSCRLQMRREDVELFKENPLKICRLLLGLSLVLDLIYGVSNFILGPLHWYSPAACTLQAMIIDVCLLGGAAAYTCLSVETYVVYKGALTWSKSGSFGGTPILRTKRFYLYLFICIFVPTFCLCLNQYL